MSDDTGTTNNDGGTSSETDAAKPERLRLGGMALRNGLLVHGPTQWAAAARRHDGSIGVASGRKPQLRRSARDIPLLRGIAGIGEAMLVIPLVKRGLPEAQLPFQNPTVLAAMAGTALAGAALRRRIGGGGGDMAVAVLGVAPSLIALRGGDLAAYHGVEHKAIAAYEAAEDPADAGAAGAREAPKEHDRCGSHLMAPLLAANLAGTTLLRRLVDQPTQAQNVALQLASIGVAVEVFAWAEHHAGTRTARMLRRPGHELQRVLGTREPTDEQLQVGHAALDEILRVEGEKRRQFDQDDPEAQQAWTRLAERVLARRGGGNPEVADRVRREGWS